MTIPKKRPRARAVYFYVFGFALSLFTIIGCSLNSGMIVSIHPTYIDSLAIWHLIGKGPHTFVVINGGPGFAHNYLRPEWDQLSLLGDVIYYDQRGNGRSTMSGPYGWDQTLADLRSIIQAEGQGKKVILAGSSFGSTVALVYAMRHPSEVLALVLSGTPPWPRTDLHPAFRPYTFNLGARADSVIRGQMPVQLLIDDSAVVAGNPRSPLASRFGANNLDVINALERSVDAIPKADSLSTISIPTVFLFGSQENPRSNGALNLSLVMPGAALVEIPSSGHDPWYDRPIEFFSAVRSFMEREIASP